MIAIAYVALTLTLKRLTKSSFTRKIKTVPLLSANLDLSQHSSYLKYVGFPHSYFHFLKRHIFVKHSLTDCKQANLCYGTSTTKLRTNKNQTWHESKNKIGITINHEDEKQRRISDLVTYQLNFESDVTESSLMLIP